ncbi:hypothetical protein [Vibrio owensii]|uniref:hypothetical protein n=1 Tax=Vibrio owensii TaxID=696485 RepID=UPI0040679ABE
MKKSVLLAMAAGSLVSGSVLADSVTDGWTTPPTAGDRDAASAAIEFVAEVPTIMAGKWMTFTGEAGGALDAGKFEVQADGQFATTDPVVLELHWYDPDTNATGELVSDEAFGTTDKAKIGSLTYTVSKVDFTSATAMSDVDDAEALVKVDGKIIKEEMPFDPMDPSTKLDNAAVTSWTIENKTAATVFGHIAAGDSISATATVTADVAYVAAP